MKSLKNIMLSAVSFLNSNQAPPNVCREEAERLRSINHLESKKFYAVMISVCILSFFYFLSVIALFFIPHVPEIDTGFVTMFSKTTEILAVIIASYVGAQAAVDFKINSSSSSSVAQTEQIIEQDITQKTISETTVIHTNAKEEDYEIQ